MLTIIFSNIKKYDCYKKNINILYSGKIFYRNYNGFAKTYNW